MTATIQHVAGNGATPPVQHDTISLGGSAAFDAQVAFYLVISGLQVLTNQTLTNITQQMQTLQAQEVDALNKDNDKLSELAAALQGNNGHYVDTWIDCTFCHIYIDGHSFDFGGQHYDSVNDKTLPLVSAQIQQKYTTDETDMNMKLSGPDQLSKRVEQDSTDLTTSNQTIVQGMSPLVDLFTAGTWR
jgi:hypothetical protein